MNVFRTRLVYLLVCIVLIFGPVGSGAGTEGELISEVALDATDFNPSQGEQVRLRYELARPDNVTIRIFDPDGGLVRSLLDSAHREAGMQDVAWDGYDEIGKLVPDESYTFTIETDSGVIYDPETFSGNVVGDIVDARFSLDGTIVYKLPALSRVLIRLGIHNGPMLKTLVDWKPRVGGAITEYWDGRDENDLMLMREHKDFTALITYVTLPDTTVITYGNNRDTYRDYKLGHAKDRLQKPKRPRRPEPELRLRPEHLVPPAWTRAPRVLMTFPKHDERKEDSVPTVQGAIDVRIEVEPSDRDVLLRDQFEIIFFVNNVFFAEAERGYLPFNWTWELQQLPEGEHILTVNVSSFSGQVGVASRKVRITKSAN